MDMGFSHQKLVLGISENEDKKGENIASFQENRTTRLSIESLVSSIHLQDQSSTARRVRQCDR